MGMDAEKFISDYAREDIIAKVQKAWDDGQKISLPGTPILVINSDLYQGPRDYASLNDIAHLIILGKRQYKKEEKLKMKSAANIMQNAFAKRHPLQKNQVMINREKEKRYEEGCNQQKRTIIK